MIEIDFTSFLYGFKYKDVKIKLRRALKNHEALRLHRYEMQHKYKNLWYHFFEICVSEDFLSFSEIFSVRLDHSSVKEEIPPDEIFAQEREADHKEISYFDRRHHLLDLRPAHHDISYYFFR